MVTGRPSSVRDRPRAAGFPAKWPCQNPSEIIATSAAPIESSWGRKSRPRIAAVAERAYEPSVYPGEILLFHGDGLYDDPELGFELESGPTGSFYKTDARTKETTLKGVYAAGDAAQALHSVSFAVADGARAGTSAHQSLVFGQEPLASNVSH